MKITGKHPTKLNDPILKHPAMKHRRWQIDPTAEPHTSFKKLSKKQIDEFGIDNMDTYTNTKHNDVDISYREFYEELKNELYDHAIETTAEHYIDPIEFSMGQSVEMEHTKDPHIASKIALDHLLEDPKYYSKLKAAGLAKELEQLAGSTGFGDPNHSINSKKRVGTAPTTGNNIVGKIGDTPDDHIQKSDDQTTIIPNNTNTNDYTVNVDIQEPELDEDRCYDKAVQVYGPKTSAYRSGAMVKCRKGKIWKKEEQITNEKLDFSKEKSQGLHGWFTRRGGKGGKGWVDCNTCRKNPDTGKKTCKSCGRQAGEKRSKYPACRPTPSQCNKIGTSRKKGPKNVSWKKKNESIEYKHFFENAEMAQSDLTKIIDYSEKLQSMFNVNDNLEDWVKAKLNHACDYVATVRDYIKFYKDERETVDEIDSAMSMGALKQINSDAKELQSMLQPNTSLEDWVKSKLNLAGEYLDDVYHHLDHFGSSGRKYDTGKTSDHISLSKIINQILKNGKSK